MIDRRTFVIALPLLTGGVLAGCAATGQAAATAPPPAAGPPDYTGQALLAKAIAAAGGEEALRKVKELYWTGAATVTSAGKTTQLQMETIVRPMGYARTASWPAGKEKEAGKMMQVEFGSAWQVGSNAWTPLPSAQAAHETQQFAIYDMMLLVPIKDAGVTMRESAPGKDGTRNLHVEHPKAPVMDMRFDAGGKLIQITDNVRDPDGGAALIPQVITLSGEMVSNGVKWPKKISITQRDAPYYDLELATFEARPAFSNETSAKLGQY